MTKKKPIGYTKQQTQSMKTLVERTQKDAGDYVGSGTVTRAPKKKMKRMMNGGMANIADKIRNKLRGEPRYETMPIDPFKKAPRPVGDTGAVTKPAIPGMKNPTRPMTSKVPGGPATIEDMRIPPSMRPTRPMTSKVPGGPVIIPDRRTPPVATPMTSSQIGSVAGVTPTTSRMIGGGSVPGETLQRQVMRKGGAVRSKEMRGGGLARKGVGMALAKGGMVKANGCAKRGKTRGKMM